MHEPKMSYNDPKKWTVTQQLRTTDLEGLYLSFSEKGLVNLQNVCFNVFRLFFAFCSLARTQIGSAQHFSFEVMKSHFSVSNYTNTNKNLQFPC